MALRTSTVAVDLPTPVLKELAIMTLRTASLTGLLVLGSAVVRAQGPVPIPENYYAAGERVELPAPVQGDAVVAGRLVTVGQEVSGDVLAAGWHVSVNAPAADDVRAAGAQVDITAPVHGDLTVAAGELTVGPQARVGGRAWLTGRTIRVDGVFDREIRIAGERVVIGGEIRQPIRVVAQRLEILPTARILAPMTYQGATPAVVAPGAVLSQSIAYSNISDSEVRRARWPRAATSLLFGIHVFFGGLLLLLLLPKVAGEPAEALRAAPAKSLLAGLALLVTVPFVAILLMISLIGLPAGLALVAAYAVALFIAVVTTAIFIGNWEGRLLHRAPATSRGQHAMLLLAGALTLMVLYAIPVIGTLTVFASVVFGLGAIGVWVSKSYAQAPAPAAA